MARRQLDEGADLLKMMVSGDVVGRGPGPNTEQYSEEEVAVVTSMAHAEGKRVAAHAIGAGGIRNAVRGGIDTVEHGVFLTAELIEEMLERGTYLVPTLAEAHFVGERVSEFLPEEMAQQVQQMFATLHENIRAARRAGVPIAAGTDVGNPFVGPDATHQEIALFTDIGMSHHEAIQAATLLGARAIGVEDDLGTVRPGRRADLLVLDGDPLDDIAATRRIRHLLQDAAFRIRDGVEVA